MLTGALFALSFDTFTLAAWFGAASGSGAVALTSVTLAFVIGMVVCDGVNGLWIAHLIGRSRSLGAGARRSFSALVACTALAVAGIGVARLGLPVTDRWFDAHGLWASAVLVAALSAGYGLLRHPRRVLRRQRHPIPHPAATGMRTGRMVLRAD